MSDEPAATPARATTETVEQLVRRQLSKALGGVRGMVEAAIPTIAFTLTYVITHELQASLAIGVVCAVVLLVARLVQRQTPQFVLNSLVGIAVAAVFAMRSGNAKDAFLPGIIYNSGYAALLLLTVAIGWPLVGFLVGSVTGDPTGWRQDKQIRRLCSRLTAILAVPCILRVVVQYPLWASDHVGLLGTAKVVMGWPLQVAALALMAYLLGRNHTPVKS